MDGERFGRDYYRREFGLDDLRRFNMHWWSVRFYGDLVGRWLAKEGGRRFLDVGCAHGYTLAWLESRFETVGVDVSSYAVGRARQVAPRSRVFVADFLEELPAEVAAGGFDAILAKYVLEHLPDPALALRRLTALLRPGGFLLYSVPNTESPGLRLKKERWFGYGDETHCSLLPAGDWLRLTAEAGLRVEKTFSDGLWDVPYVRAVPKGIQRVLFGLPCIVTVLLARPLLPARWGENLIVKARRPADR